MSEFGDEFGAVEAERADAHPPSPDPDVAGFDVAIADPAFGSSGPWRGVVLTHQGDFSQDILGTVR